MSLIMTDEADISASLPGHPSKLALRHLAGKQGGLHVARFAERPAVVMIKPDRRALRMTQALVGHAHHEVPLSRADSG